MGGKYFSKLLIYILFVLIPYGLSGQIDIDQYEKDFGKGEISLKKNVKISFFYNEKTGKYFAKVNHQYDRLYIDQNRSNGMVQVPFNTFQDVKLIKARFFKLDSIGEKTMVENVKVKYADVKDYYIRDIFYADLKVKQFKSAIILPKNYVVSYSYDVIYKDLKFLSTLYFQESNEAIEKLEISIKKNINIDFSLFEFNLDERFEKSEDAGYIKFKAINLKRYKSSSSSVGGSYYLPHVILSVKKVETPESTTKILGSTDDQYAWYRSLIQELSPDQSYIKKLSSSFIPSGATDEQKIERIFKWVQTNIQYVAFEDGIAGFKPTEAEEVAKSKFGDCKGMANLLVNLLKAEGFDANHAWIGTRSNNYSYSIPSLAVDNHMICELNHNNKKYYLDGTSKSATWEIPPPHLEGKEVLVANNDTYEIDVIKLSKPEDNSISINGFIDLKQAQPKISLNIELKGHITRDYMNYVNYFSLENKDDIPYYLVQDYLKGIKVESISKPTISDNKISYNITGTYLNVAKCSQEISVFPFLDLMNFKILGPQDAPSYVDYPHNIQVVLELKNTNGRPQESLYPSASFGNEKFMANYNCQLENGKYIIHQKLTMNLLNSPLNETKEWNSFINQLEAFNNYPLTYGTQK